MWRFSITVFIPLLFLIGQERDYIIFPHQLHVEDMELECDLCHDGVRESLSLTTRLLPEKDTCIDCHDGDTATDECSACHSNSEDPKSYRKRIPREGPEFSHVFHLTKKPDCANCHAYIYDDDGLSSPNVWGAKDCRACHESAKPANHTQEWSWIHGLQVNHLTQQNCNICHTQSSCDACHQLQQFEPKVHPISFILSHGFDARSGILDCVSCHDIQNDCQRCHRENLVMPMDHNLPEWVGPEFVFSDGGLHASAALDAPEVCQACHETTTNTCQRPECHGK